ncbi:lactate utilization protein [Dendrosporobacter sp. 1207_IL3150]|uniref:lactate utilization protein n=1 Tax=Dendrosporobacter sp. 1207_IL3150 TaxID=3084054 RepID=UPI002FD92BB8
MSTDSLVHSTVERLRKNNFTADFFESREAAIEHIYSLIPEKSVIGVGGSWTVQQLGIIDSLENQGHKILDHNRPGTKPEDVLEIRRQQLMSDVFITSTNGITAQGQLVNTDGVGNRVAAMIFGPKKVIVVAGTNKIAADLEQAQQRIKTTAAPLNNKRLNKPNPCVKTGNCVDCQLPTRICTVTTILNKRPMLTDVHIVLIGEELGF